MKPARFKFDKPWVLVEVPASALGIEEPHRVEDVREPVAARVAAPVPVVRDVAADDEIVAAFEAGRRAMAEEVIDRLAPVQARLALLGVCTSHDCVQVPRARRGSAEWSAHGQRFVTKRLDEIARDLDLVELDTRQALIAHLPT